MISDAIKRRRIRHAYPQAAYIRSPYVSLHADLGVGVGLAERVVVNPDVAIGKYSYVNRDSIIFSGSIGAYCSIGHGVQIGGEHHPLDHLSTSPRVYASQTAISATVDEFPAPPQIDNDVWIGGQVVVMQGVRIGSGAVVGANSTVTRDVPPYAIVVGCPAQVVKFRFAPNLVAWLLATAWWDQDLSDPRLAKLMSSGADWVNQTWEI